MVQMVQYQDFSHSRDRAADCHALALNSVVSLIAAAFNSDECREMCFGAGMRDRLIEKTFEWDLDSNPQTLWPLISDTARLNEALDLPVYRISETFDENSLRRRYGEMLEDDARVRWEEPAFEWVENGWWRWRRFYDEGAFRETGGVLMLMPGEKSGTRMHYVLSAEPRGAMGRMLVASGHLKLAARSFRRFTMKVDQYCKKPLGEFYSNFAASASKKPSPKLPKAKSAKEKLLTQFAEWLAVAPHADRIDLRSKRLARCLNVSAAEALSVCLHAVRSGDLRIRYRAVCSACRASAIEVNALGKIPALLACRRCGSGYHRDLFGSVEVLFSVAGNDGHAGIYCGSGPATLPQFLVQQNLGSMERRDLTHKLPAGVYLVRAVDGPVSEQFELDVPSYVHVTLAGDIVVAPSEGGSVIENRSKREYTVAIERCEWPVDALSAAEVLAEQCFHELMPDEALLDGDSATIGSGAILGVGDLSGPLSADRHGAVVEQDDSYCALYFTSIKRAAKTAQGLATMHPDARFSLDYGPLTVATTSGRMRFVGTIPDNARSLCMGGHRGVIAKSHRVIDALATQPAR